jgi:t-SNARE complex subunit (syntaxin)
MEITFVPLPDTYEIEQRALSIIKIEEDAILLKEMFLDLNSYILEQQPMIYAIVDNIESANTASKVAADDVEAASVYQHGNNRLIKYLVIIGVTVLVIVKLI